MNYYELLGVRKTSSTQEIRNAFRKLARERHPDRVPPEEKEEAEKKFQELTEAVNVLTNEAKRKQHDTELQRGRGGEATVDFAQIAKAYVSQGVKSFREGDYLTARDHFDMAVKHHQDDAKAYHYLALAAAKLPSGMKQAISAIETAVRKEPMNPLYLKDAGMMCRQVGLTAKAERYLQEALQWDRDNLEIQTALAELKESKGKGESGRGILDSLFRKG